MDDEDVNSLSPNEDVVNSSSSTVESQTIKEDDIDKDGDKEDTTDDPAVIANEVIKNDVSEISGSSLQVLEPLKDALIDELDDHAIADTINKYNHFKRLDTVQDYSDHHFVVQSSMEQQPHWAKRIQQEWKKLEKDLPDTIFVRAYEERMDLLRAVIVGVQGTPYHDGLFFFDISFPPNYPFTPPDVYYHSHGLTINPSLCASGKVCLSLLNSGTEIDNWQPNVSSILQVLLSIQALVLNAQPCFSILGFSSSRGTAEGQHDSLRYNESVFLLSLQTMSYAIKKPPKNFEEFVAGHFLTYAVDILETCKAYMDGAQVGAIVKGGGEDLLLRGEEERCSCEKFKNSLCAQVCLLGKDFTSLGVKGIDNLMSILSAMNIVDPWI